MSGGCRYLIVNADDYGLTEKISAGILRAHREGILTSTSVLALGPAYPKVAPWLADEPAIGVGVHLAAVGEDPPLLSSGEIPSLLDRRGHLSTTYRGFVCRMAAGRVDPADIEREFTAQLELVAETGMPISHLDAHQHLHLWPLVRTVVLRLARRHRITAVRVPRHRAPTPVGLGVSMLGRWLVVHADRARLRYPQDASGIEVAGQLDEALLVKVLDRLAARGAQSVELTMHPGEADDHDRHRYVWDYKWADELQALTSPVMRDAVDRHGFTLATYRELPVPERPIGAGGTGPEPA